MTTTTAEHYTIISSDCHAGGNHATYREYLESSWQEEFDEWRGAYSNPFRDLQDDGRNRNWDNERRISELDFDGIVGEITFPNTVPPFFPTGALIAPPPNPKNYERRLAGIRAHNRWLVDWCAEYPERRAGIGQIFLNDVDEALKDVQWIKDQGLRGGVLLPGIPPDSGIEPLYSDVYEPFWSLCEELEMPITHHSGNGTPNYGKHPIALMLLLVETPFYSHRALEYTILSGVFERHPDLKFIVTEQGVAWIPETLGRLDAYHAQMKSGRVGELGFNADVVLPEPPSFYFQRNCWVGASFPSPSEAKAIEKVGWDKVMWGNDYPHNEGCYPNSKEALRNAFSDASPENMHKILCENQADIYDFDLGALAPIAAEHGPTVEEIATPLDALPDNPSPAFTRR